MGKIYINIHNYFDKLSQQLSFDKFKLIMSKCAARSLMA